MSLHNAPQLVNVFQVVEDGNELGGIGKTFYPKVQVALPNDKPGELENKTLKIPNFLAEQSSGKVQYSDCWYCLIRSRLCFSSANK